MMVTYSAREPADQAGATSGQEVRDQFTRIARARLASRYKFKPQRMAIAAKMFREWNERKGDQK